ncbi:hypothetical protein EVAR_44607_1 [Eumeta japonica]|uniref:Uncharacterized protein n=1 Tax=Eumeta variegata TaxID=151549 RepID=A0A4C1XB88_EUMVA|nr:hypothetical protein EVAR_44607_1 [Eumeta japonica]
MWLRRNLVGVLCCNDDTYSILVVIVAYNFSILCLPTLSSVHTNPPANYNGLLKLRARTATHNKTRRRPVVATRGKLKYYRKHENIIAKNNTGSFETRPQGRPLPRLKSDAYCWTKDKMTLSPRQFMLVGTLQAEFRRNEKHCRVASRIVKLCRFFVAAALSSRLSGD